PVDLSRCDMHQLCHLRADRHRLAQVDHRAVMFAVGFGCEELRRSSSQAVRDTCEEPRAIRLVRLNNQTRIRRHDHARAPCASQFTRTVYAPGVGWHAGYDAPGAGEYLTTGHKS